MFLVISGIGKKIIKLIEFTMALAILAILIHQLAILVFNSWFFLKKEIDPELPGNPAGVYEKACPVEVDYHFY